jgi:NADPH:quinone reductase-like Zn-dependent oxidoreductase
MPTHTQSIHNSGPGRRVTHPFRLPAALLLACAALAAASSAAADDATMQAAVPRGGTVRVQTLPRPVAAAGEVLVSLRFAGVNPDDWKYAAGRPEAAAEAGPAAAAYVVGDGPAPIPGLDGAGVVAALGAGVANLRVGDAVMLWSARRGTYAQFVSVPSLTVVRKPDGLSFEEAAGLAHAGLAAWNLLIDIAHVHAGQSVLVLGAAGGVGSSAVQIARARGAHVIATASARNTEYLQSIGAEQVIDYTRVHFEDLVRNADVVVNTVDSDNAYRGLAVTRRGGFLVSVNGLPPRDQCAARGVSCAARNFDGTPVGEVLGKLGEWAQAGRYRVHVDRVFALTEVIKAWGYSQTGHTQGKSLIRME